MRHLECLRLLGLKLSPSDTIHFTGLSSLTKLHISHCTIGELSIAAMLQRLDIFETPLESPFTFVALACLTNLRDLRLSGTNLVLTDETLHLLSPLAGLTWFVAHGACEEEGVPTSVSRAAERAFLKHMPFLDYISWA